MRQSTKNGPTCWAVIGPREWRVTGDRHCAAPAIGVVGGGEPPALACGTHLRAKDARFRIPLDPVDLSSLSDNLLRQWVQAEQEFARREERTANQAAESGEAAYVRAERAMQILEGRSQPAGVRGGEVESSGLRLYVWFRANGILALAVAETQEAAKDACLKRYGRVPAGNADIFFPNEALMFDSEGGPLREDRAAGQPCLEVEA